MAGDATPTSDAGTVFGLDPRALMQLAAGRSGRVGGGLRAGDYELLERIAEGGMGVVYRARQISLALRTRKESRIDHRVVGNACLPRGMGSINETAAGDGSWQHAPGSFPATVWTVVLAVREAAPAREQALESLCRRYWRPVYAWVRRSGQSAEDAEDLTQAFFVKVLTQQVIERAQRERGRFRTWLLTVLRSFLADEWDRSRAQKRGGGRAAFSLDVESEESREALALPGGHSPDRAYDRRWALEVLEHARVKLGEECRAAGKGEIFRALFPAPDGTEEWQTALAERLGLTSNAVKMTARRMRRRLAELVRAEVAETVSSREEMEEEIRHLMAALSEG